jgi:hypothetical protein
LSPLTVRGSIDQRGKADMRAYLVDILAVGFFILDLAPSIRL